MEISNHFFIMTLMEESFHVKRYLTCLSFHVQNKFISTQSWLQQQGEPSNEGKLLRLKNLQFIECDDRDSNSKDFNFSLRLHLHKLQDFCIIYQVFLQIESGELGQHTNFIKGLPPKISKSSFNVQFCIPVWSTISTPPL